MSDSLRANDFMSTKTNNAEDVRSMPCSAKPEAGVCDNCVHWEVVDKFTATRGYCPIFDKITSFDHGRQCTAWRAEASQNA